MLIGKSEKAFQRIKFSEEEIEKLKILFPNKNISKTDILNEFPNRQYSVLWNKAKELNILIDERRITSKEGRENISKAHIGKSPNLWSEKEIGILIDNYPNSSKDLILLLLPNRNWAAIGIRASQLKIKRIITHPCWCKGLTKETDERVANYAKKVSESRKGIKFSEEHIKHLRESHLNPSEEIRENIRKNRAKQIFPYRDSKIEKYIQNFLDGLGIEYQTHQIIEGLLDEPYEYHRFDIVIPSHRVLLEANGCYWHGCSRCFSELNTDQMKWRKRDLDIRDMVFKSNDWNLFEMWECDIKEIIKSKNKK